MTSAVPSQLLPTNITSRRATGAAAAGTAAPVVTRTTAEARHERYDRRRRVLGEVRTEDTFRR
ncbi:hypothetical protein Amsp01_066680 [Amycolatopsis sp. NBRC 101858]|nr:hypothetical protein Amsp01_066680 [Amycolatopsis sp. NBRC 101858]